jgi:hypothetical protein
MHGSLADEASQRILPGKETRLSQCWIPLLEILLGVF